MYELDINEENIKKTIISDVLERNGSIYNFLNLIYSINTKCTISIDGDWGTGKTFFVKQVEYIMNLLNTSNVENIDPKIQILIDKIKGRLEKKNICTYGNIRAIYYNASEYDYFEEPILTIIADIIKNNSNIKIDDPKIKESLGEKIDKLISSFKFGFTYQRQNGDTVGFEKKKKKGENKISIIDEILLDKELETNFKSLLEELLVEKSNKLVIFIDELDRCNPNFAVKLLEKIKYFFDDDRFIFVFSTNLKQLQYTIEKYYGYNFNGAYYLQKFFDYQLELPEINLENYINYQIDLIPINSPSYMDEVIKETLKDQRFNLRDCNKYFELLKLKYNDIKNLAVGFNCFFFIGIMFPVLLAVKIKSLNEYTLMREGKGKEVFRNIIKNKTMYEALKEATHMDKIEVEDIDRLYNFMFVNLDEDYIVIKNSFNIRRNFINKMNELLSYLGEKVTL